MALNYFIDFVATEDDLPPCAYCGGKLTAEKEDGVHYWSVGCDECDITIEPFVSLSHAVLVLRRRPTPVAEKDIASDAPSAHNWIWVSDRLPDPSEYVIGYDIFYSHIGQAEISSWAGHLVFTDSQGDDCLIVAWQPFPAPPPSDEVQQHIDRDNTDV
jgi:hypothetical protein